MKLKVYVREDGDGDVFVNLSRDGSHFSFTVGEALPRVRGPNTTKLRALKDARDTMHAMGRKLDRMADAEENRVYAVKRARR